MTSSAPPATTPDPHAALQDLFGYPAFRPGQEEVVRAVLAGEDVLAVMPTGGGKSICYQLPAMLLPGCTVVISPLVALMKDQVDQLPDDVRQWATVFNSTVSLEELDVRMADLIAGRIRLVYVAPERLRQRPFLHALARARISRFVVDEAHCISLWGHDFRPDYFFIPDVVELLGRPPVLAMTATATPELQRELGQRFGRPLRIVHTGVVRPNLSLEVEQAGNAEEKLRRLVDVCTAERGAGIVYVTSRKNTDEVAGVLRREGISARAYHAGLDSSVRAAVQDAFMRGQVRVIVATVAFGMGVNKPDVRFIVHYNPSRSLEAYAQESGRAGRDGEPSRCILFWSTSDRTAMRRFARQDTLTPDLLRAAYKVVRQGGRGRFGWWGLDTLVADVRDAAPNPDAINETAVRVAIGALEQVGVLRRHCDLPETVRMSEGLHYPQPPAGTARGEVFDDAFTDTAGRDVAPRSGDDGGYGHEVSADGLRDIPARLGLEPGARTTMTAFEAADALGCPPSEVEERLLQARDAGLLTGYQGMGRGLLLELLPHPPDLAQRLRDLIDNHERAQMRRVDEMAAYAAGWSCRAAAIAHHFGVAHAGRCGNCDVCRARQAGGGTRGGRPPAPHAGRTQEPAAAPPDRAPEDIIIECIAGLPFPMGRRGVVRLLNGSLSSAVQEDRSRHFGALAALPAKVIEREIDALVEAGFLDRDEGEYRLLSVTPSGAAKPPAPWPPEPAPVRSTLPGRTGERRRDSGTVASFSGRAAGGEPALAAFDEDDPAVQERFERLRAWRLQEARESNLSPAYVFSNETLNLLAGARITSRDDLSRIKGVGPKQLEQYGEALLEMLGE